MDLFAVTSESAGAVDVSNAAAGAQRSALMPSYIDLLSIFSITEDVNAVQESVRSWALCAD